MNYALFEDFDSYDSECLNPNPFDPNVHLFYKPEPSLINFFLSHSATLNTVLNFFSLSLEEAFSQPKQIDEFVQNFKVNKQDSRIVPMSFSAFKKILFSIKKEHAGVSIPQHIFNAMQYLIAISDSDNFISALSKTQTVQVLKIEKSFRSSFKDFFSTWEEDNLLGLDLIFMFAVFIDHRYIPIYESIPGTNKFSPKCLFTPAVQAQNLLRQVFKSQPLESSLLKNEFYKRFYFSFDSFHDWLVSLDQRYFNESYFNRLCVSEKIITDLSLKRMQALNETKVKEFINPYTWQ